MATDYKRLEVKLKQIDAMLDEAKRQLRRPGRPICENAADVISGLEEVTDLLDDLILEDS